MMAKAARQPMMERNQVLDCGEGQRSTRACMHADSMLTSTPWPGTWTFIPHRPAGHDNSVRTRAKAGEGEGGR